MPPQHWQKHGKKPHASHSDPVKYLISHIVPVSGCDVSFYSRLQAAIRR
jgi:hypothetical protein